MTPPFAGAAPYQRSDLTAMIKAYDVRGLVGDQLTEELISDIGAAFATVLRERGLTTIAIGHDMRDSSPGFAQAFAEGAAGMGIDVTLLGLTSTDQLYFAAGIGNTAGAMFTASHNPAAYNGIKLCYPGAKPVSQDSGLGTIIDLLVAGLPAYTGPTGTITHTDNLSAYAEAMRELVDLSGMRPVKVVVEAGHGWAAVLAGLPIELVELYFELDGTFPNHEANPLDPKNLVDLQAATPQHGADIGIAFDGDADRCFIVDELGAPVSPSAICALIAEQELARHPGAVIIHNLICSQIVPETIRAHGGTPVRTRVGHSFIKATMAETGAVFGGEHSAHYYFTNFYNADSGMLAALYVLAALGGQDRPLSELMAPYQVYAASGEINSRLASQEAQQEKAAAVRAAFAARAVEIDELDGLTVMLADQQWFNVRASNTEPLLRLNVEAPTADQVEALVAEILGIIRG